MALLLWFPRPLCLLPMPSMFCWVPISEIVEVSQLLYKSSTEETTTLLAFAGVISTRLGGLFSSFRIIDIFANSVLGAFSFHDGWKDKAKADVDA